MRRTTLLHKISDGFLPHKLVNYLYNTIYFKVGITDVNGWTIVHFITGFILSMITKENITYGFQIHTIWEIIQFIIGDNKIDCESLIDISIDTISFTLGWLIFMYLYN